MTTPDKTNITTCFNIVLKQDSKKYLYNLNIIAKKLFEFLCIEKSLTNEEVSLCTDRGFVLSSFPAQTVQNTPDLSHRKSLASDIKKADFMITVPSGSKRLAEVDALQKTFSSFLSIFCHNEQVRDYIFHGLDSLSVSICIYDKNTRLVYANADFCDYIQIKDRETVYGMFLEDMLKEMGVKISSIKKPYDQLKVKDVLKYGKPIVNWEVEVVYTKTPKENILATNDMYPLFDEEGHVNGVIEIARLRNKKIREVSTALGLTADYTFDDIIGESKVMAEAKQLAATFAGSSYNILIYGESGVGKELFAQSIHNCSDRKNNPFVAINCASIAPELIDSELFGYESGAFTGASKNGQIGKFELANGGTLFLDEVAELPLHFQTKLLRTLETNRITRIGGSRNISVDVRIIAATNCALEKIIDDGLFRRDLYYRLMVLNITIPPLRVHPEDIPLCAEFFLQQSIEKNSLEPKMIDEEAKKLMKEYSWPGNIRELRNVMNRVSIMARSTVITRDTLGAALQPANCSFYTFTEKTPEMRLNEKKSAVDQSYAELIREALSISKGNKREAAELLGVSRKTLYRMLEKYETLLQ